MFRILTQCIFVLIVFWDFCIVLKIVNNIANNQETLYNSNESESGINEQIQQSGLLESNNGLSSVFEKDGNQEARKYTRTEFEQWE